MPRLSLDDAREKSFEELVTATEEILAEYDPADIEPPMTKVHRINRTLDEMPAIYRWLLQLEAWCDHWKQNYEKTDGRASLNYRKFRQRQDFFESMASAAKMRYESASRRITTDTAYDPTGMPRTRRVD